jgi:hypothetical protein
MKKMYGARLDAWIKARNQLLKPDVQKVFNNPIMQQWGVVTVV